ncbi:hypothetical protein EVAR_43794_1 [Eumeta japonica]|uniref:Uncharacterized protein n=1 Tax=Eumeta variegata TaxID=151549 RepID=A0A4C1XW12_EUMVA|nr:hypothetical protein EVAR_43794_1 [Eumeta japonica]
MKLYDMEAENVSAAGIYTTRPTTENILNNEGEINKHRGRRSAGLRHAAASRDRPNTCTAPVVPADRALFKAARERTRQGGTRGRRSGRTATAANRQEVQTRPRVDTETRYSRARLTRAEPLAQFDTLPETNEKTLLRQLPFRITITPPVGRRQSRPDLWTVPERRRLSCPAFCSCCAGDALPAQTTHSRPDARSMPAPMQT